VLGTPLGDDAPARHVEARTMPPVVLASRGGVHPELDVGRL
jgi:hypothetical protein